MRKITLSSGLPLGDIVVLTAAIHSLHRQFPNQYETATKTQHQDVFKHNPNVVKHTKEHEIIKVNYPSIHKCNDISNMFLNGYVDDLATSLDIPLKLQTNRPHLYLTDEEKAKCEDKKPYWIVLCGGKTDFTAKHLPRAYLQEVVNYFIGRVQFVQPCRQDDINYTLENVDRLLNLNRRELFSLVYNCEGVIGPITSYQHVAAAFNKPYIAVAGGREPTTWISNYPKQQTLHTIGALECCRDRACWVSKVIKEKDTDSVCVAPVYYNQQWCPKCLLKITPTWIIEVMNLYV